jgi:hypothetical protein
MEEAKIAETRSRTYSNLTAGEERMARIAQPVVEPPRPDVSDGLSDEGLAGDGPMPPQGGPAGPIPQPEGMGAPQGPQPPPAPPPRPMPEGPPMGGMMTGRAMA